MDIIKIICVVGFAILELLAIGCGLISYPKHKKLDMVSKKEFALSLMPEAVKVAEKSKETGALKKEFVITSLVGATENKFGQFKDKDKINFIDYLNDNLEATLSTPQKKEAKNG